MENGKEIYDILENLHSELILEIMNSINLDSYGKIQDIMHKYKMKVLEGDN